MKQYYSWKLGICGLLCCLLFVACKPSASDQQPEGGKIVRLADGDTFTLLMPGNQQVKVRLFGIDSPERSQDFGTAARNKMEELTTGHTIRLEEKSKDRYGRTIAVAYRDDGLNLNEEMIRSGMAWHYTEYDKKNFEWSQLEAEARAKKIGLWAQRNPTPPWEFRKEKRAKTERKKKKSAA